MDNTPLETLLGQCRAVLAGAAELLARLQQAGFACAPGHWAFRLPQLHQWLVPGTDYRRFRRALYAGELNTRLKTLGGEIAIADNQGNVDLSLYCLRRLS